MEGPRDQDFGRAACRSERSTSERRMSRRGYCILVDRIEGLHTGRQQHATRTKALTTPFRMFARSALHLARSHLHGLAPEVQRGEERVASPLHAVEVAAK